MKKIIITGIITSAVFQSCMKADLKDSNDVFVTVYNECQAEIKVFKTNDGERFLSDMYDCNYINFLPIKLPPGEYLIRATTYQGRVAETQFTKERRSKSVDINF